MLPEGQAVRVVPCLGVVALCLGLVGCSTFGKKSAGAPTPATRKGSDSAPAPDRSAAADRSPPPPGVNGILAGQVIDSYNRRPSGATFIQVTEPAESGLAPAAPIEVAADNQGYFTIQGLKTGRHYQLTARTRNGDQLLAGTTWATPPDPKILIRISEDFANSATPALPGAPVYPAPKPVVGIQAPVPATPSPTGAGTDRGWSPARSPGASPPPSRPAAELGPPIGSGTPQNPTPPIPVTISHPDRVVDQNSTLASRDRMPVTVPNQVGPEVPRGAIPPGPSAIPVGTDAAIARDNRTSIVGPIPNPIAPALDPAPGSTGPARVPSCVLTGQRLYNFALNDLNSQPWEYRRDHRGRLTLIDFWGTWCVHCLHTIPHLNILQQRYGGSGLEIIGIAYEDGTPNEQVQKVNRVRTWKEINYRLLLGAERDVCPVRTQFGVVNYPTLVLLDESGRIVWRAEGLDGKQLRELESIIRQRLAGR
jgi:thiol-disulfide isomerase/thioredoxin